ncbi:MAG: hypothetical protein U0359_19260 [Byssovorax sp.]
MSMTIEYRVIPSFTADVGGDEIYYGESIENPGELLEERGFVPSPGPGWYENADETFVRGKEVFAFAMWNVSRPDGAAFDGFTAEDRKVSLTDVPEENATATAWYIPVGGGLDGQPQPPAVLALAFDRTVNRFFRATPIDAVIPEFAWAGGDEHSVSTSDAGVSIDARNGLNHKKMEKVSVTIESGAVFEGWRRRSKELLPDPLELPQGAGGLAIAVYHQESRLDLVQTIPYWLAKLLRGIIDADVINHIKNPGPRPSWMDTPRPDVQVDRLARLLRRSSPVMIEALRNQAMVSMESSRMVFEITGRLLESGDLPR